MRIVQQAIFEKCDKILFQFLL